MRRVLLSLPARDGQWVFLISILMFLLFLSAKVSHMRNAELNLGSSTPDSPELDCEDDVEDPYERFKARPAGSDVYDRDIFPRAPVRESLRWPPQEPDRWPKFTEEQGNIILEGVGQRLKANQEDAEQQAKEARKRIESGNRDVIDATRWLMGGSTEENRFGFYSLKDAWTAKLQHMGMETAAERVIQQKGADIERVGMTSRTVRKRMKALFRPLIHPMEEMFRGRMEAAKAFRQQQRALQLHRAREHARGPPIRGPMNLRLLQKVGMIRKVAMVQRGPGVGHRDLNVATKEAKGRHERQGGPKELWVVRKRGERGDRRTGDSPMEQAIQKKAGDDPNNLEDPRMKAAGRRRAKLSQRVVDIVSKGAERGRGSQ